MRRFAVVGLLVSAACTHPVDGSMCVAGDQKACPCLGGGSGVQVCLGDGTFDVCQCLDMSVPSDDLSMPLDLSSASTPLDFSGVDLYGVDLTVVTPPDFAGVDLTGVDLTTPPPPDLAAPADFSTAPADFSTAPADFSTAPPDFAGVDLTGVDLATPPDFGGVTCGTMTCGGSTKLCCLSNSGSTAMCDPPTGSSCDGGSPFACDGPEDCNGGQCCVLVDTCSGGSESGHSVCMPSCPSGSYASNGCGGAHEVSILCHSDGDCSGYSGTILGLPYSFDACCHSATTISYHVCIPRTLAPTEGYTCP